MDEIEVSGQAAAPILSKKGGKGKNPSPRRLVMMFGYMRWACSSAVSPMSSTKATISDSGMVDISIL